MLEINDVLRGLKIRDFYIGSAKEAEEFDNLSPEEAKTRLRILVDKMDLNRDKIIERGELKAWIMRSFK